MANTDVKYELLAKSEQRQIAETQLRAVEQEHFSLRVTIDASPAEAEQGANLERLNDLAARIGKLQKIVAGLKEE